MGRWIQISGFTGLGPSYFQWMQVLGENSSLSTINGVRYFPVLCTGFHLLVALPVISNSLESYLLKNIYIFLFFIFIYFIFLLFVCFKLMTLTFWGVWLRKLKHQYSWHVNVLWIEPTLSNLGFIKFYTFLKWRCHWHSIQCTHAVYSLKVIFLTFTTLYKHHH